MCVFFGEGRDERGGSIEREGERERERRVEDFGLKGIILRR